MRINPDITTITGAAGLHGETNNIDQVPRAAGFEIVDDDIKLHIARQAKNEPDSEIEIKSLKLERPQKHHLVLCIEDCIKALISIFRNSDKAKPLYLNFIVQNQNPFPKPSSPSKMDYTHQWADDSKNSINLLHDFRMNDNYSVRTNFKFGGKNKSDRFRRRTTTQKEAGEEAQIKVNITTQDRLQSSPYDRIMELFQAQLSA